MLYFDLFPWNTLVFLYFNSKKFLFGTLFDILSNISS